MIAGTSVSDSGARRLVEHLGKEYELGSQNWQQISKASDKSAKWMTGPKSSILGSSPIEPMFAFVSAARAATSSCLAGHNYTSRRRRISSPGLGQDRGKKRTKGFDGQKQRINGIVEMHLLADLHLRTLPGEEGREKAMIVSEFNIVHGFHPVHQIEIN
jgi:hypothetical protein